MLQFDGVDPSRKNYIIYPSSHTSLKLETKKFWKRHLPDKLWLWFLKALQIIREFILAILWTFGKNTIGVEKSISLATENAAFFWCFFVPTITWIWIKKRVSQAKFLGVPSRVARNWLQKIQTILSSDKIKKFQSNIFSKTLKVSFFRQIAILKVLYPKRVILRNFPSNW